MYICSKCVLFQLSVIKYIYSGLSINQRALIYLNSTLIFQIEMLWQGYYLK